VDVLLDDTATSDLPASIRALHPPPPPPPPPHTHTCISIQHLKSFFLTTITLTNLSSLWTLWWSRAVVATACVPSWARYALAMVSAVWVYRRLVLFATSGSIGNPSEQRYRDHSHTQSQRLTRQARVAANRRRLQTFPPPFPNGWYKLCDCGDVAPGEVREIEALGELFVVFRGRHDGRIGVLDAFCPHLGANLSVGGKVEGDCIKCPFHEWQFNTDGKCTKIPYAKKVR